MPRYVSLHTLACLTRQGAGQLSERLFGSTRVKTLRVRVNMLEGKMLVEFDAGDRESLEEWLKQEGFHYDWLMRIEWESDSGPLAAVP